MNQNNNGKPVISAGFPFFMNIVKRSYLFCLLACALGLASCEKDSHVGNDLTPGSLGLITTDTITVIAETEPGEPFVATNLSKNYLGYLNDPLFGETRGSVFSQFMLADTVTFSSPAADSIVLYLPYTSLYGDITTSQRVRILELTASLPSDSSKSDYSEAGKVDTTNILADHIFNIPASSAATVRIPLDQSLAARFISAPASSLIPSAWTSYFKGLFIQSVDQNFTSAKGALLNINMDGAQLILYYKENGVKKELSIKGASAVRINQIIHNTNGSVASNHFNDSTTDSLYIGGLGLTRVKLRFPYIDELNKLNPRGSTVTINKAELKFDQVYTGSTLFAEAREVSSYSLKADGSSGEGISSDLRTNDSYSLSVGTLVRDAIKDIKEDGLVLKVKENESIPHRLLIRGGNNIKLVVTLTKL